MFRSKHGASKRWNIRCSGRGNLMCHCEESRSDDEAISLILSVIPNGDFFREAKKNDERNPLMIVSKVLATYEGDSSVARSPSAHESPSE